jgi:hypothetical protein
MRGNLPPLSQNAFMTWCSVEGTWTNLPFTFTFMKLITLLQMYLKESFSKVHTCKYPSDEFPTQKDLKHGDALSQLLFNFAVEYAIRKFLENHEVWN